MFVLQVEVSAADQTPGGAVIHKSPHPRRKSVGSGYHSEGNMSLISSDNEDISIRSDTHVLKSKLAYLFVHINELLCDFCIL